MASYDSDSSGAEDDAYTETNVLLGYASKEPTGDTISQLGGHPSWLDGTTAPSGSLAKCKVCNDLMCLLLQLNGDLPEHFPGHERRLYVFSCRRRACRRKDGSVRSTRATRISKLESTERSKIAKAPEVQLPRSEGKQPQQSNIGEALFGVKSPTTATSTSSNPFSTSSSTTASANPFSASPSTPSNPFASTSSIAAKPPQSPSISTLPETFAAKVRISSPPSELSTSTSPTPHPLEPWPPQSSFPPAYPSYHLDADHETLDAPSTPTIPSNVRMDLDDSSASGGGKEDKEAFESTLDKTFQRFADRLAQNPEQVLRYEFRGAPLLYSRSDAVGRALAPPQLQQGDGSAKIRTVGRGGGSGSGMPRCGNCGAERVFEVQLTPQAIAELEAEELGLEGMEWGTVILGVCERDCVPKGTKEGEVGYLEEWVGVQWEEVAGKRA